MAHTTHETDDTVDEPSKQDRKERYQTALRTIHHRTSPEHLPGCEASTVRLALCAHGPYDVAAVDSTLQAAVENDDVLVWRDRDGRRRLTIAADQTLPHSEIDAEPTLRRLAAHLGEMGDADQLARVNQRLAAVTDDG